MIPRQLAGPILFLVMASACAGPRGNALRRGRLEAAVSGLSSAEASLHRDMERLRLQIAEDHKEWGRLQAEAVVQADKLERAALRLAATVAQVQAAEEDVRALGARRQEIESEMAGVRALEQERADRAAAIEKLEADVQALGERLAARRGEVQPRLRELERQLKALDTIDAAVQETLKKVHEAAGTFRVPAPKKPKADKGKLP